MEFYQESQSNVKANKQVVFEFAVQYMMRERGARHIFTVHVLDGLKWHSKPSLHLS